MDMMNFYFSKILNQNRKHSYRWLEHGKKTVGTHFSYSIFRVLHLQVPTLDYRSFAVQGHAGSNGILHKLMTIASPEKTRT